MHRQYHYKIPERTLQSFHRKEPDSVWNPVYKYKDEYSDYRCTRPEAFPPIKLRTSSTVTRLTSPSMVCLSAEAAAANSTASCEP